MDDRVVITTGYLDDFNDVDDILASAHVGICWYDNVSPNFTSAGMSSGKTSAYLRFGLPVITNGYQSSRMAIETTGCGVCIDQLSGLADALRQIELNYERLSRSAFEEYERTYWFEKYRRDVARFVGALKTPSGDGLSARGTSRRC